MELLAELEEPIATANREALAMLEEEQVETLIELLTAIRTGVT